jgi:AAA+ ATPase superfamily predicted ATPase
MANLLVGRHPEKSIFEELPQSNEAQFVAVLGRRRVGKTYLVRNFFSSQLAFECSGTIDGSTASQLANFAQRLNQHFNLAIPIMPANWQQAFVLLEQGLESIKSKSKKCCFLMNFPAWITTARAFYQPLVTGGICMEASGATWW